MAAETILQHWIFTQFVLPFLLVFFILFAILEKTKIFSEENKQINALVSFIISLIFVGAVFPKLVVENLILFLTVAIIIVFIVLLLWGFLVGGEAKVENKYVKIAGGIVIVLAVIIAVIWATGVNLPPVFDFLFRSDWSNTFWTNFLFIIVIAIALALIVAGTKKK